MLAVSGSFLEEDHDKRPKHILNIQGQNLHNILINTTAPEIRIILIFKVSEEILHSYISRRVSLSLYAFNKIQYDAMTYNREAVEDFVSCATLPLRRAVLKRGKVLVCRRVGGC